MKMDLDLLTTSSYSILNKIDISSLSDWTIFYLYKNDTNKTYDLKLWEYNSEYKYIDKYWNYLNDPNNFKWDVYSRIFQATKIIYKWEEKTVIKSQIRRLIR
jgi:hypothetical protein